MRRFSRVGAAAGVPAAILATTLVASPALAQGSNTGSDVPCAVPMPWSIQSIDERFDLSPLEAGAAARDAAALWERAAGTELFDVSPDGGSPILFEFDGRQATVEARRERERALDAQRRDVESRRAELETASREQEVLFERYQRDIEEHQRLVRAYNSDIARWSRESSIPPTVEADLERRRIEIDRLGDDLQRRQRELNRRSDQLRRAVDDFNALVQQLASADATLRRDFPPTASESGTYDEMVTRENGQVRSVTRRIRVYQFTSYDDLVLVLAHEFGHALGLGHVRGSGAVMSEVFTTGVDLASGGSVTQPDLQMLARRCPGLVR